jgi:hypothetical protein
MYSAGFARTVDLAWLRVAYGTGLAASREKSPPEERPVGRKPTRGHAFANFTAFPP